MYALSRENPSMKVTHPYHLVNPSPWPIITAFALFFVTGGTVMMMHNIYLWHIILPIGIIGVLICAFNWWRDIIMEGRVEHAHTYLN